MAERKHYLNTLIRHQWNQRIKVITGIRRCGKSTLLFDLFKTHLLRSGIPESNIIQLALDDDQNAQYRDPNNLSVYIRKRVSDSHQQYYVLIDEIQFAISREELTQHDRPVRLYSVLNGLLHLGNVDVYVTGSNSKMLSKDVSTEFRGRGDVIKMYPLSFREFCEASSLDRRDAYDLYCMYGGMPYLLHLDSDEDKAAYLSTLFEEIYFKDIEERYSIALPGVLRELTSALCSSVGSLTNASKIAKTLQSVKGLKVESETISKYLNDLIDSFLFEEAVRFDIKGKKYFEYPSKYYCTDIGLRNARLGFRQQEESHIMENIIYNELVIRGYLVDVGVVPLIEKNAEGKRTQKSCEVDFIASKGNKKYYIQSALNMDDADKARAELRPMAAIADSFKKIVISKSYGKSWTDETGILRINPIDFLMDENSMER